MNIKTPRMLLTLALTAGLGTGLTAQDQQPPAKDKQEPAGKGQDVMARVASDMKSSAERLEKTDPGDVTRKIQRDIIDGLDELIKQNVKSQGGGSGKTSKMKQSAGQPQNSGSKNMNQPQDPQSGAKGGIDDEQDQFGRAKGSDDKGPHGQDKNKGEGKDEKEGSVKDGGKDEGKGQAKAESGKDTGDLGLSSIRDMNSKAKKNLAADLNRTDWGHLPLAKRLEMDAYSKERFLPRYDEALQQYYRSIAEQGQKKD